jgi:hypothetical protein
MGLLMGWCLHNRDLGMRDRIRQFVLALADLEVVHGSLPSQLYAFVANSNGSSEELSEAQFLDDLAVFFSLASKCGHRLAARIDENYDDVVGQVESSSYDMVMIGCEIALDYLEESAIGEDRYIQVENGTLTLVEFLREALGKNE